MIAMDTAKLAEVANWLMGGAQTAPTPNSVLSELCERLVAAGIPLWRVGVFVQTLHPDAFGRSFVWRPGADVVVTTAGFDLPESDRFKQSPLAILYASLTSIARLTLTSGLPASAMRRSASRVGSIATAM